MQNKSIIEIQSNLDKVIRNLGEGKAVYFLETALRILRESVDNLLLSIKVKDFDSCKRDAHKLKGSSSLYGSQILVDLLVQIESTPELIVNDTRVFTALASEFKLVIQQIEVKISIHKALL